jgi:hypothetical protein
MLPTGSCRGIGLGQLDGKSITAIGPTQFVTIARTAPQELCSQSIPT